MSTQITVTHERVDDLPAIITHLKKMRVAELLNNHFPPNGNWQGLSLGGTTVVWLAFILSEGDHRLYRVEPWVKAHRRTLSRCLGRQVKPRDLTDDRLATTLDYLGAADRWVAFERELNQSVLRVYDLQGRMVRVDTTTAATYVTPEGLFQLGHSKDHRPDLPQVKIAMAVLDPLGLPLTTTVVAGQTADDPLYLPEIAKVRQVADPTVSAGRTAGRRAELPVEHRAARVGVDAIHRAAQSAASRRHAQRHLSGAAGTPDGTTDDGDDAGSFARRDAVAHQERRETHVSSDTAECRTKAHPLIDGGATGEL
jgi:hypothetical protein